MKTALITVGSTREYIDPVRYITNESSGQQGMALIKSLIKNNFKVICIHGYLKVKPIVSKKISYIFFLFFIVSCASLNNDIKSTPFAGKLLINQNNVEQFSFNININVAKNISIIQLKKPFYGNVLEIKVQDGKNLIFLPLDH